MAICEYEGAYVFSSDKLRYAATASNARYPTQLPGHPVKNDVCVTHTSLVRSRTQRSYSFPYPYSFLYATDT